MNRIDELNHKIRMKLADAAMDAIRLSKQPGSHDDFAEVIEDLLVIERLSEEWAAYLDAGETGEVWDDEKAFEVVLEQRKEVTDFLCDVHESFFGRVLEAGDLDA